MELETKPEMVLKAIKSTKAVTIEPNEVPPVFLKGMSSYLNEPLSKIFNECFKQGIYPKKWKLSLVTPLYKKKGKMNIPGNYRPIANTYFLSKVFERVLKQRIDAHILKKVGVYSPIHVAEALYGL